MATEVRVQPSDFVPLEAFELAWRWTQPGYSWHQRPGPVASAGHSLARRRW
jgi:hypothetical protein